jgi:hypothetical protein
MPDPYRPAALLVVRAVEHLTTQVRRIADALATPVTDDADDATTTPAGTPLRVLLARAGASDDVLRSARRDSLGVLLSRAGRGVLSTDEGALLRQHVETELREGDAARAVLDRMQGACRDLPCGHASRILAALDGADDDGR